MCSCTQGGVRGAIELAPPKCTDQTLTAPLILHKRDGGGLARGHLRPFQRSQNKEEDGSIYFVLSYSSRAIAKRCNFPASIVCFASLCSRRYKEAKSMREIHRKSCRLVLECCFSRQAPTSRWRRLAKSLAKLVFLVLCAREVSSQGR